MQYLILITLLQCITYVGAYVLFGAFFGRDKRFTSPELNFQSILIIAVASTVAISSSFLIADPFIANRFLHAIGGGSIAFFTCMLAARDSRLVIPRMHIFILSFLIVSTLGVGNEILEFILQTNFNLPFADSITDTWLDLVSNTAGVLLASPLLFLIKNHTK